MENTVAHLIHNVLPVPPRKIEFIHPEDSVKKCIDLMIDNNIGALVVVDNANQLVGMVSERDIIRLGVHQGLDLKTAKVSDVVYKDVTILSPNDIVEKAIQVMTTTRRRHVLIRDKDEYIAILSVGDLLYHMLDAKARTIEQLENYIHTY